MKRTETPTISLADLRRALSHYEDDFEVSFSGLEFYRVKQRGPNLIQIEFNELVYRNDEGRVEVVSPD